MNHRPTSRARRGLTLIELIISMVIMVWATTLTVSALTYTMRANKATRTQLFLAKESLRFQRIMKQYATTAEKFVIDQGRTLHIFQPDGTESEMTYNDADNTILWVPDVNNPNNNSVLLDMLRPIDADTPIFFQPSTVSGLRVRFRLADRSVGNIEDDAITGRGFQTYVVDSVFSPRNSVE